MTDLQEALAPFWNHECAWKKEVERLRDELAVTRTSEREREQLLAEIEKLHYELFFKKMVLDIAMEEIEWMRDTIKKEFGYTVKNRKLIRIEEEDDG